MIRIRNLRKQWAERTVLDIGQLDLELQKLHAVIGPNGSGKTTLLRLLSGLDKPSSGQVHMSFRRSDIAFCFQKPYMFVGSVRDNVAMGLRAKRNGEAHANADDIMEKLGIFGLASSDAKSLSAGEMQRVSLARSMATHPRLLLLDEPTANIDPESLQLIEEEVQELNQSGATVIMATHSVERAYHLTENIIRLEKGRLAPPEHHNVFSCVIDGNQGHTVARIGDSLCIEVVANSRGPARIAIPNTDIILSLHELESSMRNSFQGKVTGLKESKNAVEVSINIGKTIRARITHASLHEMKLTVGSELYVSFKATAVKVF